MLSFIALLLVCSPLVNSYTYDRLTPENTALLLVDHQTGLLNGVRDEDPSVLKNNVLQLVEIAKLFKLPVVISTSRDDGPNGPILPEIREAFPDAPFIRRPGQINAFDNEEFAEAVKRTGRTKLLVAGVSTDVCVAFAALSAKELGYDVHAVIDASGTWSTLLRDLAINRLTEAGVHATNNFALVCELQGDWRAPTGAGLASLFYKHMPFYANLITGHSFLTTPNNTPSATKHQSNDL